MLKRLSKIKAVAMAAEQEPNEKKTQQIFDFFFSDKTSILILDKTVLLSPLGPAGQTIAATVAEPIKKISSLQGANHKPKLDELPVASVEKRQSIEIKSQPQAEEVVEEQVDNSAALDLSENKKPPTVALQISEELPLPASDTDHSSVSGQVEHLFDAQPKGTRPVGKARKRTSILVAAILAFILFSIFPIFAFGLEISVFAFQFETGRSLLTQTKFESAAQKFNSAHFWINLANHNFNLASGIFELLGQGNLSQQINQALVVGDKFSLGAIALSKLGVSGSSLISGIAGQDKGTPFAQLISESRSLVKVADEQFGQAQAELKTQTMQQFFSNAPLSYFNKQVTVVKQQVSHLRDELNILEGTLTLTPEAIGLFGEKKYLVLFQNNMELRPTGGFIGSYGLLTFADGTLKDFKIEDVYTADGQLQGHVPPPDPIRVHLGQEHWYLRDSNWDPDFVGSATRAAWFFEKEQNVAVDGVAAIDLGVIEELLKNVGPIEVADYKEKVSAQNLFTSAQTHAESDFFPGSSNKRDFLGAVARTLFETMIHDKNKSAPVILSTLKTALTQKHALLYFTAPQLQSLVNNLNWSGELKKQPCPNGNCVNDYLMVVDANLGVNKANYFVKRKINDSVTIKADGQILHTLSIAYKNDSPATDTHLGGEYKNYLRVLVPSSMHLTSAQVGELPLTITSSALASGSAVATQSAQNWQTLASLVTVPPQSEKVITFNYQSLQSVFPPTESKQTYVFSIQKQPGTANDPLSVAISYPVGWQVVERGEAGTEVAGATSLVKDNQITYNRNLLTDEVITSNFTTSK